jgi:hypothetical protein
MYDTSSPVFKAALIGALLSLPFKVYGLWKSAQNKQWGWFVSMLLFNTLGLVELTYIFYFSKPKTKD